MSDINTRLLSELFIQKEISCAPELYRKYYGRIWPCDDAFKAFLRAESDESQLHAAKEIVDRLGFLANIPVPKGLFHRLIAAEQEGDDRVESGYVGQDHAVHSVNLYILGVYLFFSHEVFHTHLIQYFEGKRPPGGGAETPLESAVKSFLTSWRIFCLSHDLGYVLERGVDTEGRQKRGSGISAELLLSYNGLKNEVIYDLAVRSLARCLYAELLLERSRGVPRAVGPGAPGCSGPWRHWTEAGPIHLRPGAWNEVKAAFQDYVRLASVKSFLGLKHLLPLVPREKILTVVKDQELRVAAVFFWASGQAVVYYKKGVPFGPEELLELDRLGDDELPHRGYSCVYFIPPDTGVDNVLNGPELGHYVTQVKAVADQVRQQFSHRISFRDDDQEAENIIFEIYRWLYRCMPMEDLGLYDEQPESGGQRDEKARQEETRSTFRAIMEEKIAACTFPKEATPADCYKMLSSMLAREAKDSALLNEVNRRITHHTSHDPMSATRSILRTYLRKSLLRMKGKAGMGEPVIDLQDGAVLLNRNVKDQGLEAGLQQRAAALDISYGELCSYRGSYSGYDHGVASAQLIMDTYVIHQQLYPLIQDYPILACAWPVDRNQLEREVAQKDEALFTEALFAVLLHNVYAQTSSNPTGIDYKQDFMVNPFSYFCAFCDNLQLWDRAKLIKQAYTDLPENRYPGSNFDLTVEGRKIHIYCRAGDVHGFISKNRDSLSTFMRDAPDLIEVTVSE